MSDDTDHLAVLDHFLEILLNRFTPELILPFLRSLGESFLLWLVPEDHQEKFPKDYGRNLERYKEGVLFSERRTKPSVALLKQHPSIERISFSVRTLYNPLRIEWRAGYMYLFSQTNQEYWQFLTNRTKL